MGYCLMPPVKMITRALLIIALAVATTNAEKMYKEGKKIKKGLESINDVQPEQPSSTANDDFSPCLTDCLEPLAKLERSFAYIFNNFERVCEDLELGARCVQKCGNVDSQRFYHITSFYRLYCVEFEEELEPHMPCLGRASQGSDKECKRRCAMKVEKQHEKEKKMKHACSSIECSTVCYYQVLTEECPATQDILLRVNLRQISEMAASIASDAKGQLEDECRHIHDKEYMRRKLLDRR